MQLEDLLSERLKMSDKIDIQVKKIINNKTVHFELPGNIHKKLRALLFLKEFSLQGFFRLMSEEFVNGNDDLIKLVEEKVDAIKNKKLEKLKSDDINLKDLYDAIEQNSPLNEKN